MIAEKVIFALALCATISVPVRVHAQAAVPTTEQKTKAITSEQRGRRDVTTHLGAPPHTKVAPQPVPASGSEDKPGDAENKGDTKDEAR